LSYILFAAFDVWELLPRYWRLGGTKIMVTSLLLLLQALLWLVTLRICHG